MSLQEMGWCTPLGQQDTFGIVASLGLLCQGLGTWCHLSKSKVPPMREGGGPQQDLDLVRSRCVVLTAPAALPVPVLPPVPIGVQCGPSAIPSHAQASPQPAKRGGCSTWLPVKMGDIGSPGGHWSLVSPGVVPKATSQVGGCEGTSLGSPGRSPRVVYHGMESDDSMGRVGYMESDGSMGDMWSMSYVDIARWGT